MQNNNILLESGTNELEILEFIVGNINYGINVAKVREVIMDTVARRIPESHLCIEGIIKLRNDVITLVNLIKYLNVEPSENPGDDKIIITEFNRLKVAFRVNEVVRIHRISWEQIHKPPEIIQSQDNCTTGIVKLDNRIILLLDFEKIMFDIEPDIMEKNLELASEDISESSGKKLILVEDSATLRKILTDYLPRIGYTNFTVFENGKLAWDYLEKLSNDLGEEMFKEVQLVITDIEMPQMDGHHLTKKIKEHQLMNKMPVIIFSSLITEDLRHRGNSVGADAQVSKPNFKDLSTIIKNHIL